MTEGEIKLAIFDMDGTLNLERSPWQLIYEKAGLWDKEGVDIQKKWMNGEISYRDFCFSDVGIWKKHGVSYFQVKEILDSIEVNPSLKEVFDFLRSRKVKICIISAGFFSNAEQVARHTGYNLARENESGIKNRNTINVWSNNFYGDGNSLEFEFGVSLDVWKNGSGEVVDPLSKTKLTFDICEMCDIPLEKTFSCGDSTTDKLMFDVTGSYLFLEQPEDLKKVISFF